MIPVLTATDIRKADQATLQAENISSHDLMERAARTCVNWLITNTAGDSTFIVFAGKGNNGGDGLAIARLLNKIKKPCRVYTPESEAIESGDFIINKTLLTNEGIEVVIIKDLKSFPELKSSDVIIDALFGTGMNRAAEGMVAQLIKWINASANKIISIDLPSGMLADTFPGKKDPVIKADVTLTFQFFKKAFLFAETGLNAGEIVVLDIGINASAIDLSGTRNYITEFNDIHIWIKKRPQFAHKGIFGHALVLGGSTGKCGAVMLATAAALRAGAGRVTARTPGCCYIPLQTALPEVMVMPDGDDDHLSEPLKIPAVQSIGAGPGLGTDPGTASVLKRLIQDYKGPLVLDADAINILAENKTWLSFLNPGTILTPHIGEFKRLCSDYPDPFERQKAQVDFAKQYNCYVILKGRYTAVACPDGTTLFNSTGNAGMATAGAGDVLTGIITGLLAQGLSPFAAAVSGVYLHGLAGDIALKNNGGNSLLASEITSNLPSAIEKVIQH